MKFGKIKVLAHRYINGGSIPVFDDRRINLAINRHVARIDFARTRKNRA